MKTLPEDQFQVLIEAGYETRNIEFKQAFLWDDENSLWLQEKVIRSILGMANTPGGGTIIIGIEEKDKKLVFGVLSEGIKKSFNYDDVSGVVGGFASSTINFEICLASLKTEESEAEFIVINVSEFEQIPVICRKNGRHNNGSGDILKKSLVYCRARGDKPSTIAVTEREMREIIEMAVDKGMRKLKQRGYRLEETKTDTELFDEQISDLL